MYSKLFFALAASVLATASMPLLPASQCQTPPVVCCQTAGNSCDPPIKAILQLLGIFIPPPGVLVGVNCTPIPVVGPGSGAFCDGVALCCKDHSHDPIVSVDCYPVDLNL